MLNKAKTTVSNSKAVKNESVAKLVDAQGFVLYKKLYNKTTKKVYYVPVYLDKDIYEQEVVSIQANNDNTVFTQRIKFSGEIVKVIGKTTSYLKSEDAVIEHIDYANEQ
jgi:hypothetical protein